MDTRNTKYDDSNTNLKTLCELRSLRGFFSCFDPVRPDSELWAVFCTLNGFNQNFLGETSSQYIALIICGNGYLALAVI